MAQRFAHQFKLIQDFDCSHHMCGVGPLAPARFEPAALPTVFQQPLSRESAPGHLRASALEIRSRPNKETRYRPDLGLKHISSQFWPALLLPPADH
jgi:hypothetical protein